MTDARRLVDEELPVRRIAILLAVAAAAVAALSPAVSSVSSSTGRQSGADYRLLQTNLCLSGQAGCYSPATHQSILDEATEEIAGLRAATAAAATARKMAILRTGSSSSTMRRAIRYARLGSSFGAAPVPDWYGVARRAQPPMRLPIQASTSAEVRGRATERLS